MTKYALSAVMAEVQKAEVLTELAFLLAIRARRDAESSLSTFLDALKSYGPEVPRYSLSSFSWGEFLGECEEHGYVRTDGVFQLTPKGTARLDYLLHQAAQMKLDLRPLEVIAA